MGGHEETPDCSRRRRFPVTGEEGRAACGALGGAALGVPGSPRCSFAPLAGGSCGGSRPVQRFGSSVASVCAATPVKAASGASAGTPVAAGRPRGQQGRPRALAAIRRFGRRLHGAGQRFRRATEGAREGFSGFPRGLVGLLWIDSRRGPRSFSKGSPTCPGGRPRGRRPRSGLQRCILSWWSQPPGSQDSCLESSGQTFLHALNSRTGHFSGRPIIL